MEQNTKIAQNKKKVITKYMKGNYVSEGLLQFFWDWDGSVMITCQMSVLIAPAKLTQVNQTLFPESLSTPFSLGKDPGCSWSRDLLWNNLFHRGRVNKQCLSIITEAKERRSLVIAKLTTHGLMHLRNSLVLQVLF